MPGADCAFPGCNVSRYKLHEGTTIFSITKRKNEFYKEWRNEILRVLLKYWDIDLVLEEKLQNGDADFFGREKNFASDDIEYTSIFFRYLLFLYILDIYLTGA